MNPEGGKLSTCYPKDYRCDRCDIPLVCSMWKEINVVFAAKPAHSKEYYCVQCTNKPNRIKCPKTNAAELDEFVANLAKKPAELVTTSS